MKSADAEKSKLKLEFELPPVDSTMADLNLVGRRVVPVRSGGPIEIAGSKVNLILNRDEKVILSGIDSDYQVKLGAPGFQKVDLMGE